MEHMWMNPSSSMEKAPDDATCWICLDGEQENDHEGEQRRQSDDEKEPEPLYRQCACRGTSSYVHISCLARLVEIDTNNIFDEELNSFVIPEDAEASKDPIFLLNQCPTCLEPYNQLFSIRLMEAYARITKKYSEYDNRRIRAHLTYGGFAISFDPKASKRILLKEVLEKIHKYPRNHPGIDETPQWEFSSLVMLAETCRATDDMAGAMLYASYARDLGIEICDTDDPFMQILAQYQWDKEGQSIFEHLPLGSEEYRTTAQNVRELFGPNHGVTILHELNLAETLFDEDEDECDETLKSALERAIQFLGLTHDITIKVAFRYAELEARMKRLPTARVHIKDSKDWRSRRAILAPAILTSEGEKYVCISYIDENSIFTLASIEDIELYKGNNIQFHHITKAKDRHINGKRGTIKSYHANKKQYEVKVEDDPHKHHMVKPQNIEVIFDRRKDE